MKDLRATAGGAVSAAPAECVSLLAAVDGYPRWYPEVVRQAEVLERAPDGTPLRARASVHLAVAGFSHNFDMVLLVTLTGDREVRITRVPDHGSDSERFQLVWRVQPGAPTRLALELSATVDVPRFLPVGAVSGPFAQGFVDAASRALEGSSPKASASSS
jgi:Polyketide cyclase / dehydrase and lipid transport